MALFTLDDFAAYLRAELDTTTATVVRTMATGLITGYTGQFIEADTYTHLLPIKARQIRVPQRPVTEITSVTIDGVTQVADTDWKWDGIGDVIWLESSPDEDQATVVYDAGYATVPDDVAAVALSIAGRLYTQTPGLVAESIDDYRAQYANAEPVGLHPGEKQILRRYKQRLGSIAPVAVPGSSLSPSPTYAEWLEGDD